MRCLAAWAQAEAAEHGVCELESPGALRVAALCNHSACLEHLGDMAAALAVAERAVNVAESSLEEGYARSHGHTMCLAS